MHQDTDTNKYIGIGRVADEPKVKYLSKAETYIIEFGLEVRLKSPSEDLDRVTCVHPVLVRNERLALYLKDTLKVKMKIYLEGALVPFQHPKQAKEKQLQVGYRIEASEILLIDAIERSKYPDDIKKIK